MPERYADSFRCASARTARQSGAAVLLAMLTLALMAGLAAFVVADYGAAADLLVGRQDQNQSRWLARAAVDWARNVLAEDKRTSKIDYLGEAWATHVAPTAVEDGEVSGEITDYSGLFDLNSLVSYGQINKTQVAAYVRLLSLLGLPSQQATSLAAALVDWLDTDNNPLPGGAESDWYVTQGKRYQVANGLLVDVDELRLIRGYDDDLVERLRPFVAALPSSTFINVNTAPPEVLAAIVDNLSIDEARAIAVRRLVVPFQTTSDFTALLPARAFAPGQIDVGSRYFLVGGRAKYGQAVTRMQVLLDRSSNWPVIVWQKIL
ncbi:MAG TPA: type II secretion system minor pseudopilin GspK [Rhodocyclaceae bacterium]|nr:type II secretion system minor pseudopilin GspK [Rhodocyclaceae bacterium]